MLLDAGANPNAQYARAMVAAVQKGREDIVAMLQDAGAVHPDDAF